MRQGPSVRRLLIASSIAAIATIAAGAAGPGTFTPSAMKSAPQDTAPRVTILFMCNGTRSVSPWEAHIKSGGDLSWVLDPRSDVTDFRIKRKRAADRWPFDGTGSIDGKKGTPARGRGKAGTPKGTYSYDIEAHCRVPGGGMQWKKIDPDIIVDI